METTFTQFVIFYTVVSIIFIPNRRAHTIHRLTAIRLTYKSVSVKHWSHGQISVGHRLLKQLLARPGWNGDVSVWILRCLTCGSAGKLKMTSTTKLMAIWRGFDLRRRRRLSHCIKNQNCCASLIGICAIDLSRNSSHLHLLLADAGAPSSKAFSRTRWCQTIINHAVFLLAADLKQLVLSTVQYNCIYKHLTAPSLGMGTQY